MVQTTFVPVAHMSVEVFQNKGESNWQQRIQD